VPQVLFHLYRSVTDGLGLPSEPRSGSAIPSWPPCVPRQTLVKSPWHSQGYASPIVAGAGVCYGACKGLVTLILVRRAAPEDTASVGSISTPMGLKCLACPSCMLYIFSSYIVLLGCSLSAG